METEHVHDVGIVGLLPVGASPQDPQRPRLNQVRWPVPAKRQSYHAQVVACGLTSVQQSLLQDAVSSTRPRGSAPSPLSWQRVMVFSPPSPLT